MTRSKASSKKQRKRGVDFKKIKRKIGRKLPPANNATNTEIKSKAIILPEQSVASEKEGLAVNKKGLTLKELLQQTSHHNPKVRRDAMMGIKDLFRKHPAELRLHKYAVVEKLCERIGDDDKVVRETLYQLFKSVIFPTCKEDNQELFISLIMAHIFNAMTHLAIDVRLMAFKFLDLVVESHPESFFLYAEKILQNYGDILRNNQFYLQDKGKLKNVLAGLLRCLSLVPCNKKEVDSCEKNDTGQGMLHVFEPDVSTKSAGFPLIIKKLKDLVPVLVNCFQDFIQSAHTMPLLDAQSFDCLLCILQSIDIAFRFFIYGTDKGKSEYQLPQGQFDVTVWDESISSLLMKKILLEFPINPAGQLSEKDDDRYFILNVLITGILLQFNEWISSFKKKFSEWIFPPPAVLDKFLEFIENALRRKDDDRDFLYDITYPKKDDDRYFILYVLITGILLQFSEWISPIKKKFSERISLIKKKFSELNFPPAVLEKFPEFIENALLRKICNGTRFGKGVWEKHLLSFLPFFPKLFSQVEMNWRSRLLQVFTNTFRNLEPSLKLACLSTIEDTLIPKEERLCLDSSVQEILEHDIDQEILEHQIGWIRELPRLLILLDDKHPSCTQAVLHLQLRLGQCTLVDSLFAREYDNMQHSLLELYSTCQDDGNICYGPFIRLPRDSQELSLCCLCYFSNLDSPLLKSIASCCLSPDLEQFILFRIIEVLHSAYTAGHIKITDHISFFITLLSHFKVFPGNMHPILESDSKIRNRGTFKLLSSVVCSNLSQIGDNSLVFQILEKVTLEQILLKPPLDNASAMLRMLAMLDSKPTRLSERSIITLSNFLLGYLIDVVHCIQEDLEEPNVSIPTLQYYLIPCFFFFDRSHRLLDLVLKMMGSLITDSSSLLFPPKYATDCSSRINAIVSVLVLMHKDVKVQQIISSLKAEIDHILSKILSFQSLGAISMTMEERHKIQCAFDQLKVLTSTSANGTPAI